MEGKRTGASACVAAWVCLLACGPDERTPLTYTYPNDGGEAGDTSGPDAGQGGTGSGAMTGSAARGGTGSGNPGSGSFDLDEVYLIGELNRPGQIEGIAPWRTPNTYTLAFPHLEATLGPIGILGSEIIYRRLSLYRFSADLVSSEPPETIEIPPDFSANDVEVETPACDPRHFIIGPGPRLLYQCTDTPDWYEGTRLVHQTEFSYQQIRALGYDDLIIDWDWNLAHMTDGVIAPVPFHQVQQGAGIRATPNGFRGLTLTFDGAGELTEIAADGSTAVLGAYPPHPESAFPSYGAAALAADDTLFYMTRHAEDMSRTLVVRATLSGESEIIYDEGEDQYLLVMRLLTGP